MKLVSMSGRREKMDELLRDRIMGMEVEFENPLSLFKSTSGFVPHTEPNPYDAVMKRFISVFEYAGVDYSGAERRPGGFSAEELGECIEKFDGQIHSLKDGIQALEDERRRLEVVTSTMTPILDAQVHIEDLSKLKFMKFRFGRLPIESYAKLETYLGSMPAYFTAVKTDRSYAWGFYFVPGESAHAVDHIMATLYFERFYIEGENSGTPKEIVDKAAFRLKEIENETKELTAKMNKMIEIQKKDLLEAFACVKFFYDLNQIKRYAAYTKNNFYLTFWTDEKSARALQKAADEDKSMTVAVEDAEAVKSATAPTKLRNWAIFRPFEEFVKMYGMPRYNEIDPTAFLAVIYSLFFGMMFGDVGHGLCLLAAGILLTVFGKGGFLGKVAIPLGVTSTFFGFMYGTFFGFEGSEAIIKPLWFTPMENMNRILITTVVMGVFVILLCMIFNVINGVKQKNWQKIAFSQNGLAGMVFYILVLYAGVSAFMGSKKPMTAIGLGIGVSLILIFLQEPLAHLLEGRKNWMPEDKGGFFVQSFFELFEILLSFVTNTMSFVRVGAFALNHAGMMSVVLMFMHSMSGGGSVAVTILGNLLVMGLEGLIVGIQVLRLGFYEMFSRFYDGDGRAFRSVNG